MTDTNHHQTKSDRRGLRDAPMRHCDCPDPRYDHQRAAWGFVYTEWCCGCGRPSEADQRRHDAALAEQVEATIKVLAWRCKRAFVALANACEQVAEAMQAFVRVALRESVGVETTARMMSECIDAHDGITLRRRGTTESAWYRCLRRWVNGEAWSPWLHRDWIGEPRYVGDVHGVRLLLKPRAEDAQCDPDHDHPEWSDGCEYHSDGESLVMAIAGDEPLRSVYAAIEFVKSYRLDLREIVLVGSAEVADQLQQAMALACCTKARFPMSEPWPGYEQMMAVEGDPLLEVKTPISVHTKKPIVTNIRNSFAFSVTDRERVAAAVRDAFDGLMRLTDAHHALPQPQIFAGADLAAGLDTTSVAVFKVEGERATLLDHAVCDPHAGPEMVKEIRDLIATYGTRADLVLDEDDEITVQYEPVSPAEARTVLDCRLWGVPTKPVINPPTERQVDGSGPALPPAYAHAPGALDAYPVGQAPGELGWKWSLKL